MASKPPSGQLSCQRCHTPGKVTSQCRKPSRLAMVRASCHNPANRVCHRQPPFASGPRAKSSVCHPPYADRKRRNQWRGLNCIASSFFPIPAVSQRQPQKKSSRLRKSAVVSSTSLNSAADSCTSATSTSAISSMRCMPRVAASTPAKGTAGKHSAKLAQLFSGIRHPQAQQGIATAQVVIQKRQGSTHRKAVQPQ